MTGAVLGTATRVTGEFQTGVVFQVGFQEFHEGFYTFHEGSKCSRGSRREEMESSIMVLKVVCT